MQAKTRILSIEVLMKERVVLLRPSTIYLEVKKALIKRHGG